MIEPAFAARSYTPVANRACCRPTCSWCSINSATTIRWRRRRWARRCRRRPSPRSTRGCAAAATTSICRRAGTASSRPTGRCWSTATTSAGWRPAITQFASSPEGGGGGPMTQPAFVAPELAARVGWATQSDALLYVNVKGVTVTRRQAHRRGAGGGLHRRDRRGGDPGADGQQQGEQRRLVTPLTPRLGDARPTGDARGAAGRRRGRAPAGTAGPSAARRPAAPRCAAARSRLSAAARSRARTGLRRRPPRRRRDRRRGHRAARRAGLHPRRAPSITTTRSSPATSSTSR